MQESNIPTAGASRISGLSIVLIALLIVTLLGAAGLGVLAFSLNGKLAESQKQLVDTQAQLQDLQGQHTALQSDQAQLQDNFDQLTSENAQAKADLETAQGQVKKLEADLKAEQDKTQALTEKIDRIRKLAGLVDEAWNGTVIARLKKPVVDFGDNTLISLFNQLEATEETSDWVPVFNYIVYLLVDSVK